MDRNKGLQNQRDIYYVYIRVDMIRDWTEAIPTLDRDYHENGLTLPREWTGEDGESSRKNARKLIE